MTEQHNEKLNNIISKLTQDKEKELSDLEKKLENKYKEDMNKLSFESKSCLDAKIKEYEEKIKIKTEENNQLTRLVDSERNDFSRKSTSYEKQLKDSSENINRLQQEISLLKNQLNILENEFTNNKALHKSSQDELKEKYKQMDQEHKENMVIINYDSKRVLYKTPFTLNQKNSAELILRKCKKFA